MIENNSVSIYFQNLLDNLYSQNNIININLKDRQFTTSRPMIISHSQILEELFGDTQENQFTIENDLDIDAFGEFINFVNSRNIDFNKTTFDKLLEVYEFCKAPLFRDYLAINAPSLDMQFNFLQQYEDEGLPTEFLIVKIASQIKQIVENWDKVHVIDSSQLIRVLSKSDLSQFDPKEIYNFVNGIIQNREDNPSGVISVFNLTVIPLEDLYKLQFEAEKSNIHIQFLYELKLHKDFLDLKTNENEIMSDKVYYLSHKNAKSSVEFKTVKTLHDNSEVQAVTKIDPEKINFSLLFIGQEDVGKTSLIYRFFVQKFSENKIPQEVPNNHFNYISKSSNIDIIDIDGFYSFDNIRDTYIPRTHFFMLVCSPDVENSVDYIREYYKKILKLRNTTYVPSVVCLNKSDLLNSSDNFANAAKNFALSINAEYLEVSAKNGKNIDMIFDKASEKYSKHNFDSPFYSKDETQ